MSRVKVDLNLNKSQFDGALKDVKHQFGELKSLVAAAFTVEAIRSLTEKTFVYADSIDKTSLRMKMTTAEVQALGIVAGNSGSSLEKIEKAFQKIEYAKKKALQGDKIYAEAFGKLGLDSSKLSKSGNTLELASTLAQSAKNGSTGKEGVALQELGLVKTAGDLAAIGDSLKDFSGTVEHLKSIGAIMSDEDIANIAEAKDQLDLFGKIAMARFAPIISGTIDALHTFYITFEAIWSNIFAAIITVATDTFNAITKLPKALIQNLTGKGPGFTGLAVDTTKTIASDLKQTIGTIPKEIAQGVKEYNAEKDVRKEERAKARLQNIDSTDGDVTGLNKTTKAGKGKSIYTDSLTSIGNMLGASFTNLGSVTTQMEVQKQQLSKLSLLYQNSKDLKDIMAKIESKIRPSTIGDWTSVF